MTNSSHDLFCYGLVFLIEDISIYSYISHTENGGLIKTRQVRNIINYQSRSMKYQGVKRKRRKTQSRTITEEIEIAAITEIKTKLKGQID